MSYDFIYTKHPEQANVYRQKADQGWVCGQVGEKWGVGVTGYRLSFRGAEDALTLMMVMAAPCS